MVRFIAAITVVSVCCCSSAVQAQPKPPAKRQVTQVSRPQQVDDARSREQKDNSGADPDGGTKPLSPELEQLLIDWAASSQKIQRLEGEHLRRIYDMVYEIEKFSQGRFYYETPDKGRINITPVPVTPQMLTARAKEVADAKAENRRSEVRVN